MQAPNRREAIRSIVNVVAEISKHFASSAQEELQIHKKSDGSIVTGLDLWAEQLLYAEVRKYFIDAVIVCEERQSTEVPFPPDFSEKPITIVAIDPLDGTENYAQGLPFYGISIGAMRIESGAPSTSWGILALPALGKIIFNDWDAYFEFDLVSQTERVLTFAENSFTWFVPRWFYGNWRADPQALRTTGSSVFDLYHVVRGAAVCTFSSARIWDILGGLAMGAPLGISLFCMESGKELLLFSSGAMGSAPQQSGFQLRQSVIICRRSDAALIFSRLKSR